MEHAPATNTYAHALITRKHTTECILFLCFTYPSISSATLIDLSEWWKKKETASEISRKHVKNVPIEKSVFNAFGFSMGRRSTSSSCVCCNNFFQ
jgi:hypothetical protein